MTDNAARPALLALFPCAVVTAAHAHPRDVAANAKVDAAVTKMLEKTGYVGE